MSEWNFPEYVWKTSWSANRLHAVGAGEFTHGHGQAKALCDTWVYDVPPHEGQQAAVAKGLPLCKRCVKRTEAAGE